jgi:mono/diheme cytochrome c family protein
MLFGSIVAIGLLAVLVAIAVENPPPPPRAGLGERVYYRYCVDCHGRDGRGSWRALLFVIRPGDLTDPARLRADSDDYLRMLIKHGGAPLGKPGMPAFEFTLDDRQIDAVIAYVRGLSRGALPAGQGAVGVRPDREPSAVPAR